MSIVRFLVDTSAWVRYVYPKVAARLDELAAVGALTTCGVVELELLGGLEDSGTYARVASLRQQAFPVLDTGEADVGRALDVQARLVAGGAFRAPWAALLVAAVAERHGVAVLHGSRCIEVIARVTGQAGEWVAPPRTEHAPSDQIG